MLGQCTIKCDVEYQRYKHYKGQQLVSSELVCLYCKTPWAVGGWFVEKNLYELIGEPLVQHWPAALCYMEGGNPFLSPLLHQCRDPGPQVKNKKQLDVVSSFLPTK